MNEERKLIGHVVVCLFHLFRAATNLEKSGYLTVVREKSGKVEKSGEMCFACGVLR